MTRSFSSDIAAFSSVPLPFVFYFSDLFFNLGPSASQGLFFCEIQCVRLPLLSICICHLALVFPSAGQLAKVPPSPTLVTRHPEKSSLFPPLLRFCLTHNGVYLGPQSRFFNLPVCPPSFPPPPRQWLELIPRTRPFSKGPAFLSRPRREPRSPCISSTFGFWGIDLSLRGFF